MKKNTITIECSVRLSDGACFVDGVECPKEQWPYFHKALKVADDNEEARKAMMELMTAGISLAK